ncbi:peptidase M15 [Variibacter gotjawalensis]|uniref:Murein endopeptidase K n=2 Tax=Variibacter gotjawalensis TaxID=1333996 RepID=A0A0S3PPB6_9BRAD|nr:DUF882 domain-containing protein [Variibacter gotjawalensis]RZS49927.1 uncharacterized protein YcbK (DUF882 family) [Variibacter gotjawalensis]BAT57754.1 peptidase M15 [Variibacter gotjawalensis]
MPLQRKSLRLTRGAVLAALACLFAIDATADSEVRTLTMHHTHSKENITVVFKRNGRYDDQGLAKINYFLRDWRNHDQIKMDPRLFDVVWEAYQDAGGTQPIQIISAYRSPATNSMLRARSRGVAKHSQHMLGKAMDFNIPGVSLDRLRASGLRLQRGGVGFYPGSNFVHLDVGSIRMWPRMNSEQLARVFPDGRTVHVPSDGRPLRGYQLALADVAKRGASPSATSVFAARSAGIDTTTTSTGKRSFFARMFSRGGEDDEEETNAAPARGRVTAESRVAALPPPGAPQFDKAQAAQPAQLASAAPVPMPRSRPNRALETGLVAAAVARPSPAQVVASRGFWTGADMATNEPQQQQQQNDGQPRMVWQTGAQPVTTGSATAVQKKTPAPRPRPDMVLASAETASVPWPNGLRDEKPAELVMAYAPSASAPAAVNKPAVRQAAPMGAGVIRPAKAAVPSTPPVATKSSQPMPVARLGENPWLRGVMLAPSLYAAMDVTIYGTLNTREIATMMRKPRTVVANSFNDEPDFGLSAAGFSGNAVVFPTTVMLGNTTASLN